MKRATGAASTSSTLTRLEARKAILGVKAKRSTTAAKKTTGHSAKKASPSFVERYLGHFGVGSASKASKKAGAKKTSSSKKSTPHKSAATKPARRAS